MDPILVAAARKLMVAQKRAKDAGVALEPADLDAFVKEETNGRYGLDHVQKLIGSIDTSINPRNVGRSLTQGLTFNWADELLGKLKGDGAEDEMRLRQDLYHGAHPAADIAGEVTGGVGGGLLAAAAAPEVAAAGTVGAVGRGMLAGAAGGAAGGAGAAEGGLKERAKAAILPALFGAGMGGILSSLGGVIAARNPAVRAASRLGHSIDNEGGPAALAAQSQKFADAGRGDEVMLGDLGDHMRSSADFAANNSDDVLVPLAQKVKARQADASDRLTGDARELLGSDPFAEGRAAELKAGTREWANGPEGYGGIRDANPNFDIAPIADALKKPTVKSAWKQARLSGDLVEGSPLDKMMSSLGKIDPAKKAERPVTFDDLQSLKQTLDGKVTAAYAKGNGSLGKAYKTIRDEVVHALEESVPNYAEVDAKYAARKSLEKSLAAGEKAWDQVDTRGLQSQVAGLNPDQLDQFRYGLASKMIAKLRSSATNRDQAKEIMDASSAMQDKLKLVFGDKATFDKYMERVAREGDLAKMRGPISGSETARRLQAVGFDPAELGLHVALNPHGGIVKAVADATSKIVRGAVTRGTAREMGPLLMTQGNDAIQELLKQWAVRPSSVSPLFHTALPMAGGSLLH